MAETMQCFVDPSRPCGSCQAFSPKQCPYAYLLDYQWTPPAAVAGTGTGTALDLTDVTLDLTAPTATDHLTDAPAAHGDVAGPRD